MTVASYAQEGPGGLARWLDTRGEPGPKPGPGSVTEVTLSDDVPIALLNVTGVHADAPGFVTAYRCDAERPATSSLNVTPGRIAANLVMSDNDPGGRVCLFTQSSTHLVVDLVGVD